MEICDAVYLLLKEASVLSTTSLYYPSIRKYRNFCPSKFLNISCPTQELQSLILTPAYPPPPPPPTMGVITTSEGTTYGEKFIAAFKAGFAENNHATTMEGMLADSCDCDWSDGFAGSRKKCSSSSPSPGASWCLTSC